MTTGPKPRGTRAVGDTSLTVPDAKNLTVEPRQPGHLQGTATLVIHTRQAQRLLRGRPKTKDQARIIGLHHFSRLMRAIGAAASQGDPDAKRCRLQVLEGIEDTRAELFRLQHHVEALLQSIPGVEVDVANSSSPVRVPLRFGTPYGFMGAYLISDFDRLVRAILTAQHMGLLPRDHGEQVIRYGSKSIRRVLAIPLSWKPLSIGRDDRRQDNQRAQTARRPMNDLPDSILAGTRRAHAAPTIPTTAVGHDEANEDGRSDQNRSDQTKPI